MIAESEAALYGDWRRGDCDALPLLPGRTGPVAQWLEPTAHNGLVAGSSPAGPTMFYLSFSRRSARPTNETTNAWFLFGFRPIASAASERKSG